MNVGKRDTLPVISRMRLLKETILTLPRVEPGPLKMSHSGYIGRNSLPSPSNCMSETLQQITAELEDGKRWKEALRNGCVVDDTFD